MSSQEQALRKVVSSALQHLRASAPPPPPPPLPKNASQPTSSSAEPVLAAVQQREDIAVTSYLAAVHLCTADAAERARYETENGAINWEECEKTGVAIADKIISKTKNSRDGNTPERLVAAATTALFFLKNEALEKEDARKRKADEALTRALDDKCFRGSFETEKLDSIYLDITKYIATELDLLCVSKEIQEAVQSVFPREDMRQFLLSNSKGHCDTLAQVSRIVLGIQLWHDVTGKSGHSQQGDDQDGDNSRVAAFSLQDIDAALLNISSEMAIARSLSTKLYRALDSGDEDSSNVGPGDGARRLSEPSKEQLEEELVSRQLCLGIMESIHSQIRQSKSVLQSNYSQFWDSIRRLQAALLADTELVSKKGVFALFEELAKCYSQAIKGRQDFQLQQRLFQVFLHYRPITATSLVDGLASMDTSEGGFDTEGQDESKGSPGDGTARPVLCGYCIVDIVKRRLPIKSIRSAGQLEYMNQVYGFSSKANKEDFEHDPEGYLGKLRTAIGRQPALLEILGLSSHEAFQLVKAVLISIVRHARGSSGNIGDKDTGVGSAVTPPSAECGTQTLVHLRDFGIDYKYEWNEWVLRRRALLLCNLRQCSSSSAQTQVSHFRREQDTQCWLPKDAEQQTPAYAATSMPRRVRCVSKGLKVIDLELDVQGKQGTRARHLRRGAT